MRISLWPMLAISGALLFAGCRSGQNPSPDYNEFPPTMTAPAPAPPPSAPSAQPAQPAQPADKQLIVTAAEGLTGKVSSVNTSLRFVVLTFPIGHMPAVNQQLNVYRAGLKVGVVNITGPQRDDSIVGDIIMGEAREQDEVRDR